MKKLIRGVKMDEWYNVRIALLFAALYCIMRIIEVGEW